MLDLREKKKLRCIWLAPDKGAHGHSLQLGRGLMLTTELIVVAGDQQIVRPPPLDSMQYANLAVCTCIRVIRTSWTPWQGNTDWRLLVARYPQTSRFGQSGITKIQRTDALAAQLEKTGRFMDTVHTYEQSTKMLVTSDACCMPTRSANQSDTIRY